MGFFARCIIAVGIIYWLSPEPVDYGSHYHIGLEADLAKDHAAKVLAALVNTDMQAGASRDDIEELAVKAGKALAALDPETRKALIDQYFAQRQSNHSVLRGILN
ncbi:hypothetical protein [Pseudochelatococcus sp. G4_1912]|uniref:hypothetical protein n=1 Tax=Pseudochelatococcus sp. G4_1912 TaxID=3114288 RepID=UPI0039C6B6E6